MQFVPYRGTDPALLDLMAGRIDVMFDQVSEASAKLKGGRIKAYAVTAKTRLPSLPDIPTVDEAGLPGLYINIWYGLWAPRHGSRRDRQARRGGGGRHGHPAVQKRFAELGSICRRAIGRPRRRSAPCRRQKSKNGSRYQVRGDQGGVKIISSRRCW